MPLNFIVNRQIQKRNRDEAMKHEIYLTIIS